MSVQCSLHMHLVEVDAEKAKFSTTPTPLYCPNWGNAWQKSFRYSMARQFLCTGIGSRRLYQLNYQSLQSCQNQYKTSHFVVRNFGVIFEIPYISHDAV